MAASLDKVKKAVTEVLNASVAGSYSATIDSNNYQRVAEAITEACRDGANLIAKAILANPNHVHRNVFIPASAVELTHGGELPDMAGEGDLIEIQHYADEVYRIGIPRSAQEVNDYRLNTSNLSSVYGPLAHNAQYSPLAGFYAISRNRFYFTGTQARGYFPVINRDTTVGTAGVAQVETITISNGCSLDGNATVTVTAEGMPGSPISLLVGLSTLVHPSADTVATQIATDLNDFTSAGDIADWFTASTSTADVILTAKAPRANDTTMNIAVSAGSTGIGSGSGSTTTNGVAPDVASLIPNEYEAAWVALAVGFTLKEGDNLEPVARYYREWGMSELQAITGMGALRPLPTADRAVVARQDN